MEDYILNISPIDGRYKDLTAEIREVFSEYNLIKNRIIVEIKWLLMMSDIPEFNLQFTENQKEYLNNIINKFDLKESLKAKEIEETTKHDVKAVEYYINEKLTEYGMVEYCPLVHFACTSEDINNLAYGIMEKQLVEIYIKNIQNLLDVLKIKVRDYSNISMLSHTHGQVATPTTVGKEFSNFVYRINKVLEKIKQEKISGKFNGTVGNFNAHFLAYPNIDWLKISEEFVENFGLECNLYTTQIESHDNISILFSEMKLLNNILLDLDNDMWMYISRNYFLQENVTGEVGSSVMPHKINPINFENSMANCKMANGVFDVFINNLQISRMQRDLSDSSVLRNMGIGVAYSIIAIKQTIRGLNRIRANEEVLSKELDENPEVLAEAVQTILRKNKVQDAYNILKGMTRGKKVNLEEIREFINSLEINSNDKEVLLKLTPKTYIGIAEKLANNII